MAFAILYTCILQFNVKRLNRGIKYLCKIKNLQYMPWIINIFVNVENTIKCLSSIFQDPSKKVEYIPCMNDIRVSNSFFLCIKMFKWIYVGSKILIGVGRSWSTQREPSVQADYHLTYHIQLRLITGMDSALDYHHCDQRLYTSPWSTVVECNSHW